MAARKATAKKAVQAEETVPAVREETNVISLDFLEEDAGDGLEDLSMDDVQIPMLKILAGISPEVTKGNGKYVAGAAPGDILNTVTGEVFDGEEGILVVPVAYKREYLEWRPKDQGGGLVGFHDVMSETVKSAVRGEKGIEHLPNGNELQNTAQHYVLLLKDDGSFEQAYISMKSSQLKKSKKWNSMMLGIKMKKPDGSLFSPACYSHTYHLTSVPESNDRGNWNGWAISNSGPLHDRAVYEAARSFAKAVRSGEAKASHDDEPVETNSPVETPF